MVECHTSTHVCRARRLAGYTRSYLGPANAISWDAKLLRNGTAGTDLPGRALPPARKSLPLDLEKCRTYRTERPPEPSRAIRLPFSHYHAEKLDEWPPTDYARRPKNAMMLARENAIRIALPVPSFRSVRYACHFRDNPIRDQGRAQAIFGRPYGTERKTGHGEAF